MRDLSADGSPAALRPADLYGEALTSARELYKAIQKADDKTTLKVPSDIIGKLTSFVRSGNQEILALADRSASDNYLYGHLVNVTIFSLRLGVLMKLPDKDLETLGVASFLHDVGMAKHMEVAQKASPLTDEERKGLENHVHDGQQLLAQFPDLNEDQKKILHQIIGQSHERIQGGGYPAKAAADDIHPFAKIIGLCDVYESVTHMRPWRTRVLPHEALREMIEADDADFEPLLVKSMVEALSLYPPGSFVKLNTGEIARVTAINDGLPMRPHVRVMIGVKGQRAENQKTINLASQPTLYIAEAVDETKIRTTDQRLALELRAQRWWVRGL